MEVLTTMLKYIAMGFLVVAAALGGGFVLLVLLLSIIKLLGY